MACAKCGAEHLTHRGHPSCTAHTSRGACRNAQMAALTICRFHGGAAAQTKAAARRRLTEARAVALAAHWGVEVDTTPTEAILAQVKCAAGHVAFYRAQVEALAPRDMVWGRTRVKTGGDDRGVTHEASPNIWLNLYNTERERLVKFCAEAIRAGIEERRVRLAEQQGALVADVIKAILADLSLTPAQQAKVPEIVPVHLRLLTA